MSFEACAAHIHLQLLGCPLHPKSNKHTKPRNGVVRVYARMLRYGILMDFVSRLQAASTQMGRFLEATTTGLNSLGGMAVRRLFAKAKARKNRKIGTLEPWNLVVAGIIQCSGFATFCKQTVLQKQFPRSKGSIRSVTRKCFPCKAILADSTNPKEQNSWKILR